jgi:hypothetical protein
MKCPLCAADNPEGNRYCGACGAVFDAATAKLRSQIIEIVDERFKDKDLVATSLADRISEKVESKLKQFAKIVSFAIAILIVSVGIWGFRTFESAKARIDAAAKTATDDMNGTSTTYKKQLDQMGKMLLERLQGEARPTEEALKEELQRDQQRLATLKQARQKAPQTPIGALPSQLFTSTLTSSPTVLFYSLLSVGDGVSAIQRRLTELHCYAGPISGSYDDATVIAVRNWRTQPPSTPIIGISSETPPLSEAPTGISFDNNSIGMLEWSTLFSVFAVKCQ